MALATLIVGALPVFGTANYVYHERSGADPGCGGQYVTRLNPTSAETHPLRFKVEYQFFVSTGAVYYTTDGSAPIGAFGGPSNTTQVVPATFACTFGGGPVVDVWEATIPAQAAGTVVRYIVSAWHTSGGNEVFANSGECCPPYASLSGDATNFQYTVGSTTDLYWDTNGVMAGAGGATPTGTWGTDTFWSSVFDGTAATGGWISGRNAIFSAGTDASGAFTVTVSGTQTAGGMTVEDGAVTIAGGAVAIGAGNVTLNSGTTLSTDSSLRLTATAGATMTVNGATLRTTNPGAAGTFYDADFAITLGPNGGTFSHVTANILNIVQTATTISGPGGLTKTGVGVLAIAGTGTYLGPTIINDGELRIRTSANRIPIGTAVTVNNPGILNLNSVSQQIGSLSGNGRVGLGSGTLTVGDATDTIFTGSISNIANAGAAGVTTGAGRIIKTGTGSLTLTGSNAYTGSLTVSNGSVTAAPGSLLCDPLADIVVHGGSLNLSNSAQTILSLAGSGGTVNLGSGHTLTVNNSAAKTFSGVIAGPGNLIKTNTGNFTVAGNNTYEGTTLVSSGRLSVASATALGNSSAGTEIISGAELLFDGAANIFTINEPLQIAGIGAGDGGVITIQNSANITLSGPVTLAADSQITVSSTGTGLYNNPNAFTSLANQNLTLQGGSGAGGGGTISGVIALGTGGLTKLQGGRWTLSGANTYSGPTTISAGTLRVANTAGSATGSGAVTVNAGGTLTGPGSIAGSVTINGNISPGTSPGTLNTGDETWNGGGTYVWEINDTDAGAGVDPGWDLLNITGGLTINAVDTNKFTIRITSLTLANAAGDVHDFDNSVDHAWTIAKATTGITGFDAAAFNLDSASFSNALGTGLFIIETANAGNDIALRFVRRPAIAIQPVGGSAECTSSFMFAVTATGTAPLGYQWKHAGTNLPGATSPTLTVPAMADNGGIYNVEVVNAYGTATSDPATLTVVDTTPPVINCGQNETLECGLAWDFTVPIVSDACDGTNVILSIDSSVTNAACGNTFTATRIWRVADQSGNSITCTQVVTIVDHTPPTITCASNETVACGAPLNFTEPGANDLCSGTNVTITILSTVTNSLSCGYSVTRTWQATDPCTNSAQCSQTILVMDAVPPTITCPSNQVANIPAGQTNAVVTYPSPEATDSCSSVTTACVPASGSTFPAGTTTVTCTATDGCSNVATCTFTVTVSTAPVAGNDTMGAVANHSASVSAAKLLANDSSAGGYPLTISAVSPASTNGGTVALSAGIVTYTPVANFTGTDVFTYTLEDDQGGTATGTVIVLVRSANDSSLNQLSATPTQNGVLVRFAGIPGRTYGVERSVDSTTWTALGSAAAQSNGLIEFEDTNPPQGGAFYRTVVP